MDVTDSHAAYGRNVNTGLSRSYALFPHHERARRTSRSGCAMRRSARRAERRRARGVRALELVPLGRDSKSAAPADPASPGGQRQRVALAPRDRPASRAVSLLDEPLGALGPAKLRREMQLEDLSGSSAGARDHVHLRDARPGGGADDERPPRRCSTMGSIEPSSAPPSRSTSAPQASSSPASSASRTCSARRTAALHDPPEKVRLLEPGEQPPPGNHVERGRIEDVIYLGVVTRYVIRAGGRGDAHGGAPEHRDRRGRGTGPKGRDATVAWREDQTFDIDGGAPAPSDTKEKLMKNARRPPARRSHRRRTRRHAARPRSRSS